MNLIVILLIIENFIRIKISYILHQNDLFSRYINSFFILSHNFLPARSTIFFFISSFLFSFLFSPFPFDILPFRPLLASPQDLYPISFLFSLSVSFFRFLFFFPVSFSYVYNFFNFLFIPFHHYFFQFFLFLSLYCPSPEVLCTHLLSLLSSLQAE